VGQSFFFFSLSRTRRFRRQPLRFGSPPSSSPLFYFSAVAKRTSFFSPTPLDRPCGPTFPFRVQATRPGCGCTFFFFSEHETTGARPPTAQEPPFSPPSPCGVQRTTPPAGDRPWFFFSLRSARDTRSSRRLLLPLSAAPSWNSTERATISSFFLLDQAPIFFFSLFD